MERIKRCNDELKADRPTLQEVEFIPRLPISILVENIRSVHNVGSIFRSADGIGAEKIYISGYTSHPPRADLHKTALGAEDAVPWEYYKNPTNAAEAIKNKGIPLVLVEQTHNSKSIYDIDFQFPLCFMVGNEVKGVSEELSKLADIHVGFSFDSTEIFLEGMQQDPLDILIEIAGGVRSDINIIDNVYVSMRLQRIGWPTTRDHEIKGLFEANIKHCGLVNVKYQKERYYATQTFGPIIKVVARGDNSKSAFTRCARTLRNITLEDAVYRSDLLDTYKTKDYPKFNEIAKIWKDTKAVSQTSVGGKSKSIPA